MTIKPIHTFPDPVLKTRAEEVTDINGEVQDLIDGMGSTMYHARRLKRGLYLRRLKKQAEDR
ncbi:MAG: peptide deformylase [Syntrophobacterales bacterium]